LETLSALVLCCIFIPYDAKFEIDGLLLTFHRGVGSAHVAKTKSISELRSTAMGKSRGGKLEALQVRTQTAALILFLRLHTHFATHTVDPYLLKACWDVMIITNFEEKQSTFSRIIICKLRFEDGCNTHTVPCGLASLFSWVTFFLQCDF
jgi:hypothetical protein